MMHKTCWFLIFSGLFGCTMGPDYYQAAPSVPKIWQAKPTADLKQANPEDLKTWWKNFGDTQLNTLMAQALIGNIDLKMALTRIEQSRAERRGTRAELFPKVDVTTGAQHNENPFPGFAPGIRYNLFELGFDALREIDLFGRQQRRLEAATANLDATVEQYQ